MNTNDDFDSPVLSGLALPILTSDQATAYEVAVESMQLLTARYAAQQADHDPGAEQSLRRQIEAWAQKERDLQPGDDTAVHTAQQDANRALAELRGHGN